MFTTQVALVQFDNGVKIARDELMLVATALETQIVRDFAPIWGASAVVSPFARLEEVPPEYYPLVIAEAPLPGDHHGFHSAMDGRRFALIHNVERWSVTASHELLEMVCDPSAERTMPGPSLKDEQDRAKGKRGDPPQGVVDYLVEVCDPCEESTYDIDGVLVSDFVTPHYYDTFDAEGHRYSFLGGITKPREILEGGYLSWCTREPRNSVWQAVTKPPPRSRRAQSAAAHERTGPRPVPIKQLDIHLLEQAPEPSGRASDADVRVRISRKRVDFQRKRGRDAAKAPAPPTDNASWELYGKAFRKDVKALMGFLEQPPPSIRDIIGLLEEVGEDGEITKKHFSRFNIPPPRSGKDPVRTPKGPTYRKILAALKQQEKLSTLFGPEFSDPGLASWLCHLMP